MNHIASVFSTSNDDDIQKRFEHLKRNKPIMHEKAMDVTKARMLELARMCKMKRHNEEVVVSNFAEIGSACAYRTKLPLEEDRLTNKDLHKLIDYVCYSNFMNDEGWAKRMEVELMKFLGCVYNPKDDHKMEKGCFERTISLQKGECVKAVMRRSVSKKLPFVKRRNDIKENKKKRKCEDFNPNMVQLPVSRAKDRSIKVTVDVLSNRENNITNNNNTQTVEQMKKQIACLQRALCNWLLCVKMHFFNTSDHMCLAFPCLSSSGMRTNKWRW